MGKQRAVATRRRFSAGLMLFAARLHQGGRNVGMGLVASAQARQVNPLTPARPLLQCM